MRHRDPLFKHERDGLVEREASASGGCGSVVVAEAGRDDGTSALVYALLIGLSLIHI